MTLWPTRRTVPVPARNQAVGQDLPGTTAPGNVWVTTEPAPTRASPSELDEPGSANVYGHTKLAGERDVPALLDATTSSAPVGWSAVARRRLEQRGLNLMRPWRDALAAYLAEGP